MTTTRAPSGPGAAQLTGTAVRPAERTVAEPRPGGISHAVAARIHGSHPYRAYAVTTVVGWALLAILTALAALLVTKVLLHSGAVADADEWFPRTLAEHRRGWLTDASDIGSRIGDVPVIPALVFLALVAGAVARRMRIGIVILTAIVIELTLYRLGALVGPRERPDVPRLDDLPVDESFPSGHVAASTVVYAGLALIISSWARRRWVTVTCWTVAVVLILTVATSRMYRGMHHPIDAFAGLLLGIGCLAVAIVAVRAYGIVADRRAGSARADAPEPAPVGTQREETA